MSETEQGWSEQRTKLARDLVRRLLNYREGATLAYGDIYATAKVLDEALTEITRLRELHGQSRTSAN